jgi:hypothetical protein
MHPRRPLLKRVALWTAAVVLLLASYVLGAPFVAFFGQRYTPKLEPVFIAVYAPLVYVSRNSDAPGHTEFNAYVQWCHNTLDELD